MANSTQRWIIATTTRFVLVAALLSGAGWIYYWLTLTAPTVQSADTSHAVRRVMVFKARQVPMSRQWSGYGVTEAIYSADVPARVTAVVTTLPQTVTAGTAVQRGQLLVELDSSDFERQVHIARQDLADLKAQLAMLSVDHEQASQRLELDQQEVNLTLQELHRVEQLQRSGAAHEQDLDRAKRNWITAQRSFVMTQQSLEILAPRRDQLTAQLQAKQSHLDLAQLNLERCRIVSPMDGVLQSVDIEVGENVTAGQRVARVVNLTQIEVPLRLPAEARTTISVGDTVELTTAARNDHGWPATVARIAPENDPQTRTVTVFAQIQQPSWSDSYTSDRSRQDQGSTPKQIQSDRPSLLAPGTFIAATVTSQHVEPRWVVPRRAIHEGSVMIAMPVADTHHDDGHVITSQKVLIDYSVRSVLTQLGLPDDQWAVLDSPLKEGQWILVNASTSLLDGQAVEPIELSKSRPTLSNPDTIVNEVDPTPYRTEIRP